jgi:hypothetical protein
MFNESIVHNQPPGSVLLWSRLGRCADTLEDAAAELQSVITVVEATSQPMSRRDPMRPYMDIIYKYAQDKSPFKPSMVPRVTSATVLHWLDAAAWLLVACLEVYGPACLVTAEI